MVIFKKTRAVLEMIRMSHVVFAMPFALVSLLVAEQGMPPLTLLVKILLAVLFARNAAMTFNRLMDIEFDRRNPRTQKRHLVTGELSKGFAWMFWSVNVAAFVGVCAWINPMALRLAVPTVAIVCFYSLTKRFTAFSHFALGLALAVAPMGAWVAVRGTLAWQPVPLAFAVFFWVAGFDIIYATQDEHSDREQGLHSTVVALGKARALWVARCCHAWVVPLLVMYAYLSPPLGLWFYSACAVIALLLLIEHRLVTPDGDLARVNDAFFRVNGLISLLLLTSTILDLVF